MFFDFGDEYIFVELMLLGILQGKDKGLQVLKDLGLINDGLCIVIIDLCKGCKVIDQSVEESYNVLVKFVINFNERVENGKFDFIIGCDEEMCWVF